MNDNNLQKLHHSNVLYGVLKIISKSIKSDIITLDKTIEERIESLYNFCINLLDKNIQLSRQDSVHDNYLICLEDMQRVILLKPYLKRKFNLTPHAYRQKWKLSPDYPMVAPNYTKKRSFLAMDNGLGKKKR